MKLSVSSSRILSGALAGVAGLAGLAVLMSTRSGAPHGTEVPQKSAADYYFSRPNLPDNIHGVVMGDPPGYSIIRSEDVAWLYEAYCERYALLYGAFVGLVKTATEVPESGRWPLSDASRFSRIVTATFPDGHGGLETNIVVGYHMVTNSGRGIDSAEIKGVNPFPTIVSPAGLATNSNVYVVSNAWDANGADWNRTFVTNIFSETQTVPAYSNCTSLVELRLTNGTVSVWTNTWTVFAPTSATVVVTNVSSLGKNIESLIFKNREIKYYERGIRAPGFFGYRDVDAITNNYAYLRDNTRSSRRVGVKERHEDGYMIGWEADGDGERPIYSETTWDSGSGGILLIREHNASNVGSTGKYYFYKMWKTINFLGTMTLIAEYSRAFGIPNGPSGGVQGIKSAQLYAKFNLVYRYSASVGYSRHGDTPSVPDQVYSHTNTDWVCVYRLGTPDNFYLDEGTNLCFNFDMTENVMAKALAATGIKASIAKEYPDLKYAVPDGARGEDSHGYDWSIDGYSNFSEFLSVEIEQLLLLIDIDPRTKLPGW